MNKKILIAMIVLGIMLVGVASANLLPFFGKITGSATVKAPTFYTNAYENEKETILSPSGEEIEAYLLSPEKDGISSPKTFDVYVNCTEALGGGCKRQFVQFFSTKKLELDYFYKSSWEFQTNIKLINKTNSSGNCKLVNYLYTLNEESGEGNYTQIGESSISDSIPDQWEYADISTSLDIPRTEMESEDRFYVEYYVKCNYGQYNLRYEIGKDTTKIKTEPTE